MPDLCHRCHGELLLGAPGTPGSDNFEERALYCPHCGAPQLRLPDYLRHEPANGTGSSEQESGSTSATLPPPRPNQVEWRPAIVSGSIVALVAAILVIAGLAWPFASFLSTLWVIGAAAVALGLYSRRSPQAWMDGRIGLRVGVATGVLMLTAIAIALAIAGVVLRFGLHRMGGFDAQVMEQMSAMQQQLTQRMIEQGQPAALREHMIGFLGSPEVRGGLALFYLGTFAVLILLFSAGGGAFAGMLRGVRKLDRPRE